MSDNITKRVGLGTAYGFAKAGGYEGTVAEFTELLGNIAIDLARIENLSVTVTTLPAGSQATASLNGSVLSLGIPKGDKGDKGNTGDTGAPAGFGTVSATVDDTIGTPSVEVTASGADTAKNFAFAFHNLKGEKGDKGDTGEVSEAELTQAFEDFSANGTVANAEQLTTDIRANDQTPYLFRTAGGSVDIGDREYINGIVGGTVAWNQLVKNGDFSDETTNWLLQNCTATVSGNKMTITATTEQPYIQQAVRIIANHKYLMSLKFGADANNVEDEAPLIVINWQNGGYKGFSAVSKGSTVELACVLSPATNDNRINAYASTNATVGDKYTFENVQTIDLTQMFGSTIADYIYSLEQANAGAGVAFFKSLFPKPYYAYNAGELKSVKGLVSHDMVGFNQWDEDWEVGALDTTTGANATDPDCIRSKNYIRVVPSATYYVFKDASLNFGNIRICRYDANKNFIDSPDSLANATIVMTENTHYVRFYTRKTSGTATYSSGICINLSWDGSEDGNYEPYQKWSYPLDSDLELRGIPKLDNGNLYYDGDTYESDGTVTRRFNTVTFDGSSDEGWVLYSGYRFYPNGINLSDFTSPANAVVANIFTDRGFTVCAKSALPNDASGAYSISAFDSGGHKFMINVGSTELSDVVAYLSAHPLTVIYEVDTPTTETADPYTSPQIVNDFGTEEFVISNIVAVPIPVGHNTDYPINLKAKVEMMPNSPSGDGDYIVRQTSGTNEYVSIANNATIQNILARLEALEG